jgi:hypothetical protein
MQYTSFNIDRDLFMQRDSSARDAAKSVPPLSLPIMIQGAFKITVVRNPYSSKRSIDI